MATRTITVHDKCTNTGCGKTDFYHIRDNIRNRKTSDLF